MFEKCYLKIFWCYRGSTVSDTSNFPSDNPTIPLTESDLKILRRNPDCSLTVPYPHHHYHQVETISSLQRCGSCVALPTWHSVEWLNTHSITASTNMCTLGFLWPRGYKDEWDEISASGTLDHHLCKRNRHLIQCPPSPQAIDF